MQRAEDEVAGLGGGQRRRDRLEVAHLAEQDHVGVLTERAAESVGEARCVLADLALVDDAPLVVVQELDRILDRDDVIGARAVDLVDDRGERRRLARAGRAGDEDEPARLRRQLVEARRKAELLERANVRGDRAERRGEALALVVRVDAEAGEAANAVGEVELAVELEMLLLLGRRDPVDQLPDQVGVELRKLVQQLDVPVTTDGRQRPGREMQVGGVEPDGALEQARRPRAGRRQMCDRKAPRVLLSAGPARSLRAWCRGSCSARRIRTSSSSAHARARRDHRSSPRVGDPGPPRLPGDAHTVVGRAPEGVAVSGGAAVTTACTVPSRTALFDSPTPGESIPPKSPIRVSSRSARPPIA